MESDVDVTQNVARWLQECRSLSDSHRMDEQALLDAEEALLRDCFMSTLDAAFEPAWLMHRIEVEYVDGVDGLRTICMCQRAGNIFCEQKPVRIAAGSRHAIRQVDPRGTMSEIGPYVEVVYANGFILEPVRNVRFWLRAPNA